MKKDLRQLVKEAREQGWTVTETANGHLRFDPPRKCGLSQPIFHGSTDSDHRSLKNHIARMRRYGFKWKGR